MFVLPRWIDPTVLSRLIDQSYLTAEHVQRDAYGGIQVAMDLRLTTKGKRLIHPEVSWKNLAMKGSLAGASFTGMSLVILYLG